MSPAAITVPTPSAMWNITNTKVAIMICILNVAFNFLAMYIGRACSSKVSKGGARTIMNKKIVPTDQSGKSLSGIPHSSVRNATAKLTATDSKPILQQKSNGLRMKADAQKIRR